MSYRFYFILAAAHRAAGKNRVGERFFPDLLPFVRILIGLHVKITLFLFWRLRADIKKETKSVFTNEIILKLLRLSRAVNVKSLEEDPDPDTANDASEPSSTAMNAAVCNDTHNGISNGIH